MPLLHLTEVAIQLRKTEGSVHLRAGEHKAITGELYSFNDTLCPFSLEDRLDAMPLQSVPQFVPVATTGKLLPNRIVNLVPGSVGLTKPLPPDGLLARSQMQPETFGQLAAYLRIEEFDVAVGNGLPVITDPIVDQMTMGMGLVEVPHQQKLRVDNSHALHVLLCDLRHQSIGHPRGILRRERQGDMSDVLPQTGIEARLILEILDHLPYTGRLDTPCLQHARLLLHHIADRAAERSSRNDLTDHGAGLRSSAPARPEASHGALRRRRIPGRGPAGSAGSDCGQGP